MSDASDALVFFGATGRSRLQADLSGAAGPCARRGRQRSDRRRRQVRAGGSSSSAPAPRTASSITGASTKPPSPDCSYAACIMSTATTTIPQTFQHLKQALGSARAAAALSGDPALAVRRGRVGARRGGLERERPARGRKAVRPRPRVGARAQPDPARAFSRAGDLPHRPLPRQGAGPEHRLHPLRQRNLRAAVEPPLRSQHPDHHGGVLRRAGPRRVLRRDRRAARRGSEPPAAGCRQSDDGSADRRGVTRPRATRRRRC